MTSSQLGSRPIKSHYQRYQFTRNEKVCPYCANAVKMGGRVATKVVYLMVPLLGLFILDLLFGYDFFAYWYAEEITGSLAALGFIGFYWLFKFEKA